VKRSAMGGPRRRVASRVRPWRLPLLVSLAAGGCSLVTGTTQPVSITTSVPNAQVWVDGVPVGNTVGGAPFVTAIKKRGSHVVHATAEGQSSYPFRLTSTFSSIGTLDAVGCYVLLLPCLTLITGHAYALEPEGVYLELHPTQE